MMQEQQDRCGTAHARQDDGFEGCTNWHWVHSPSRVWAARCLNEAGWGEADGLSTLDKARMHSSVPFSLNCRAGRLRKMLDWQGTQTHALMVAQTSGRGAVPDRDDWQGPCMCSSPPAASPCERTGKHVPISKLETRLRLAPHSKHGLRVCGPPPKRISLKHDEVQNSPNSPTVESNMKAT